MRSKLVALSPNGDLGRVFDLDEISGRNNKASLVIIGSAGSDIELENEPDVSVHLEWSSRHATWKISNQGRLSISINKTYLEPGKSRPLVHMNCTLGFGGSAFWFLRTPAKPEYNGKEASVIPIPKSGLKIGRKTSGEGVVGKLDLDSDIVSISSNQAEIVIEGTTVILVNHNADPKRRTKLNGSQNFESKALVFGDVIQIPDYDYYSFQFIGDSIIHVGASSAIYARGLTRFAQGGKKILSDVNIDLEGGDFVGVLGGSGQGKSTLMKALCGVDPATNGEVWIEGRRITSAGEMSEMGLGYVPQDDIVHKELTVYQALTYSTSLRLSLPKQQMKKALTSVLETLALTEHQNKPIHVLSGGQRKRVSIASELVLNPRFLFLDEPTSGLDPLTEWDLMGELSDLARKRRMGILCTTHVLQRANLFSSIIFVHGGRIIFDGKPEDAASYFLVKSSASSGDPEQSSSSTSNQHSGSTHSSRNYSEDVSRNQLISDLPRIFREVTDLVIEKESGIKAQIEAEGASTVSEEVKKNIRERAAYELEADFHKSRFRNQLIPVGKGDSKRDTLNSARKKPSSLRTLQVLFARQWRILTSDRLNWLFLLAQAIAIGFLVGWVSENLVFQGFITVVATLWFGCSNGAQQIVGELAIFRRERLAGVGLNVYIISKLLFLSAVTSFQALILFVTVLCTHHLFHVEISSHADSYDPVAERKAYAELFFLNDPVLMKARSVDETAQQIAISGWTVEGDTEVPPPPPWNPTGLHATDQEYVVLERIAWFFRVKQNVLDELGAKKNVSSVVGSSARIVSWKRFLGTLLGLRFGALLAASLCGVTLGLMISASVRSETQAVMWVPLILIPQILFGGFVVTSPEMLTPVRIFSRFLPSYNVQRIMDTANLYGRTVPMMSTKTKIPAFQSQPPFEKDVVRWVSGDGKKQERRFDRVADANKSWQNLAVQYDRVGMWDLKVDQKERDSTEERGDVFFQQGMEFYLTQSAVTGASTLGGWVIGGYLIILLGLYRKQTGK